MKRRHTETEKKAIVSLFASSNCSVQIFSHQVGVAVPTLYAWRKKYSACPPSGSFVEIKRQPEFTGLGQADQTSKAVHLTDQALQVKINGIDLAFMELPCALWFSDVLKNLGS